MSVFATLLTIVVPVFLVVAAGYGAVRWRLLGDGAIDPLIKYATTVAVPVLLFLAMARLDLGQAVQVGTLVGFYGAGTLAFVLALWLSRTVFARRPGEAVAVGFAAMYSNVVMLGIPIAERAYGGAVLVAVFGLIALHSPYNYLLGFVAMEVSRRDGQSVWAGLRRAVVTTVSNPLMVGLIAGIAVNLLALPMPGPVVEALEMVRASALPVALFSLGAVLTRYRLRDSLGEALMVSAVSLIVHPAVAWILTVWVFDLDAAQVRAAVLLAAMPAGINGYIFATLYGRSEATAASAALIATALSLATVTLWLAALGGAGG